MVALRCIDQADVSQELLPGVTAQGFRELGSYIFVAPLDGVELYIDEAPAEAVQVDGQSGWRWTPGFYAGVVIAELLSHSGQRLAEYRLDVAPEGSKLGEGVFHTLLEELRAFDPALLFGTEAAQASIGVSGEVTSPLLAYARLRRHSDALQAALRAVMVRPLTRLQRERVLVPAHRVRRLDAASAVGLLRRPATVAYLNDEIGDPDAQAPLFEVTQSLRHCRQPCQSRPGRGLAVGAATLPTGGGCARGVGARGRTSRYPDAAAATPGAKAGVSRRAVARPHAPAPRRSLRLDHPCRGDCRRFERNLRPSRLCTSLSVRLVVAPWGCSR
jgi:hypothetical protein